MSVSPAAPALNLHGSVVAEQLPPDQPVSRLPEAALALMTIASPWSARQVLTPLQLAIPASVIVGAPVPVPVALSAVAIVTS